MSCVSGVVLVVLIQLVVADPIGEPDTYPDKSYLDDKFCQVSCSIKTPCSYPDQVDFRIIVLASNNSESLQKCLTAISDIYNMGWKVSVDVWIDQNGSKQQEFESTLAQANKMKTNWKLGRLCIHQRTGPFDHGLRWVNSWRPMSGSEEIALILDDNVDVSNRIFHWLLLAHEEYDKLSDVAGYSLGMGYQPSIYEKQILQQGQGMDNAFLYELLDASSGFSPHPEKWKMFQDWYQKTTATGFSATMLKALLEKDNDIKDEEKHVTWEQNHEIFSQLHNFFTVYCNLNMKYGRDDLLLSMKRKKGQEYQFDKRMHYWQPEFGIFPEKVQRYR